MNLKKFFLWGFGVLILIVVFASVYEKMTRPAHVDDMWKLAEFLEEGRSPISEKTARSFMAEIMPLVEEAAGRKFGNVPRIRVASRKGLARVIATDTSLKSQQGVSNSDGKRSAVLSESDAEFLAAFFLGLYSQKNQVIYLLLGNISPMFKRYKIDFRHANSIIKLVIAHELTHALQDQEIDLEKAFGGVEGDDELDALRSTIEGHASFVERIVAKKLGIDEAIVSSADLMRFKDPAFQIAQRENAYRNEFIYKRGYRFVELYHSNGGNKMVWEILSNPPKDTRIILQPERYTQLQTEISDPASCAEVLDGIESSLGEGWRSVYNCETSKAILFGTLANVGTNKRDSIIGRIVCIQTLVAERDEPLRHVTVSLYLLEDSICGAQIISAFEEVSEDNVQRMRKSNMFNVAEFSIQDFAGIRAEVSRRIKTRITWQLGEKDSDEKEESIWQAIHICRGNIYVEIAADNFETTDNQIIDIANEVFYRLEDWGKSTFDS